MAGKSDANGIATRQQRDVGVARDQPSATPKHAVRVLARGLAILRTFAPRNEWRSNQEIAAATDLPKPTVSRFLSNLVEMGYLETSGSRGQYRLSPAVLTLGYAALSRIDILEVARPLMRAFATSEDALLVLASRDGQAMVCREVAYSRAMLTLRVNVGSRLSLARSALGGALIGSLPEFERKQLLNEIEKTYPHDWPELRDMLADAPRQMQERGFFTNQEALETGVNGIGVVLDLPNQPNKYILGIAGPAFRFQESVMDKRLGPRLLELKKHIEREMRALEPLR